MIAFDAASNSGALASTTSTTFALTVAVGTGLNGIVVIVSASRGGTTAALTISGITYGGVAAVKARRDEYSDVDSGRLATEIWYVVNPPTGANNVIVTEGGTVSFSAVTAMSFFNVDAKNPIDNSNGNSALGQASPITNSVTTLSSGAWLVDSVYSKTGGAIAVGANQFQKSNVPVNSGGDQVGSSSKGPISPPASTAMAWTYTTADDYCQTIVSLTPSLASKNFQVPIRPRAFAPGIAR